MDPGIDEEVPERAGDVVTVGPHPQPREVAVDVEAVLAQRPHDRPDDIDEVDHGLVDAAGALDEPTQPVELGVHRRAHLVRGPRVEAVGMPVEGDDRGPQRRDHRARVVDEVGAVSRRRREEPFGLGECAPRVEKGPVLPPEGVAGLASGGGDGDDPGGEGEDADRDEPRPAARIPLGGADEPAGTEQERDDDSPALPHPAVTLRDPEEEAGEDEPGRAGGHVDGDRDGRRGPQSGLGPLGDDGEGEGGEDDGHAPRDEHPGLRGPHRPRRAERRGEERGDGEDRDEAGEAGGHAHRRRRDHRPRGEGHGDPGDREDEQPRGGGRGIRLGGDAPPRVAEHAGPEEEGGRDDTEGVGDRTQRDARRGVSGDGRPDEGDDEGADEHDERTHGWRHGRRRASSTRADRCATLLSASLRTPHAPRPPPWLPRPPWRHAP